MVTSPPLRTCNISVTTLFNTRADAFQLLAAGPEQVPLEESKILRFVRTPAGRGVAIVRIDGGETWVETDGGHNLARLSSWPSADQVAVLDGGAYGLSIAQGQISAVWWQGGLLLPTRLKMPF